MNHGASTARCGRGRRCTVGRLQETPVSVLFGDESIVPVRGQLARTIPQPDIHYGLYYKGVNFVPRRDGGVYQVLGDSDYYGFGDDTTLPSRAEAERAVNSIATPFT
jgi:glycine/D-amino acid oxidase-like deaminating enzyme